MLPTYDELAKMIDHSLLKPELTDQELERGCKIAKDYGVVLACVKPYHVKRAAELLAGSGVKVGTVIGFPHGANKPAVKAFEAQQAIDDGAQELDMVLNIGALISGEHELVRQEITAVVQVAHLRSVIVKVILENCYLTDAQKVAACKICEAAGADFVKTSTGFGTGGATVQDVSLMRGSISDKVQVKAAGGVRTLKQALAMLEAGCTRIGATATVAILDELRTP